CGDPVHGLYCRQCALIRKTLEEVFQDTSESSDDDTNFVNENQQPFVVNQDPGKILRKVLHTLIIVVTSWNRPTFYDNDDDEYTIIYSKPKAITPNLPIEEPDNSLSMEDEYLDTIPSVENLVPIPSKLKGIPDDTCDVPVCEDPSTFDALSDHFEIYPIPTMMVLQVMTMILRTSSTLA
ncbi:hypothetical protein Tco_0983838, partial [Tanacetum coccineum]